MHTGRYNLVEWFMGCEYFMLPFVLFIAGCADDIFYMEDSLNDSTVKTVALKISLILDNNT